MDLPLTTPALFFPAISVLLLAYTNRHAALSNRIRSLHSEYKSSGAASVSQQIQFLRKRVQLVKWMQLFGITSILLSVATILLLFLGLQMVAKIVFVLALITMVTSLSVSILEILRSLEVLDILLDERE
ncbi:MAG: DUF2721 domain-containing protein [Verrucomicrobia bacterium]|nr:DUF2721 domain-containing protein [Verrucomicrobiota bacterium]